ncbi:hypothetical protein, partial [Heyndrickxia acidicola]|nr:hypothetical protein [Heyndrickxia acidicola]
MMPTLYIAGYILLVIILFVVINLALRRGRNENHKTNVSSNTSDANQRLNKADTPQRMDTSIQTQSENLPSIRDKEKETKAEPLYAEKTKEFQADKAIKDALQEAPNSASATEYVVEPAPGKDVPQKEPDL